MIQNVLHKTFSVALALLVFFSTVSFTVEKHFCGDVLVDVSVFSEVQKCALEALEIEMAEITKMHCCKDTVDLVKGQDHLTIKKFEDLDFDQQLFLSTYAYSYINLFEGLPQQVIPHKYYSPPNLVADIQVRDQVFLI